MSGMDTLRRLEATAQAVRDEIDAALAIYPLDAERGLMLATLGTETMTIGLLQQRCLSKNIAWQLRRLERGGMVEMSPNPDDGRSRFVTATPAGRKLGDLVRQVVERSPALRARAAAEAA